MCYVTSLLRALTKGAMTVLRCNTLHVAHRMQDKITRGHSWKLVKNHCHCNTRLQFISQMEQLSGGRHQRIICQLLQTPP